MRVVRYLVVGAVAECPVDHRVPGGSAVGFGRSLSQGVGDPGRAAASSVCGTRCSLGDDTASDWFGGGRWLLDVQAHGNNVDEEIVNGVTFKREDGQLMLLNIPGS